jgi:hypothetical protein
VLAIAETAILLMLTEATITANLSKGENVAKVSKEKRNNIIQCVDRLNKRNVNIVTCLLCHRGVFDVRRFAGCRSDRPRYNIIASAITTDVHAGN